MVLNPFSLPWLQLLRLIRCQGFGRKRPRAASAMTTTIIMTSAQAMALTIPSTDEQQELEQWYEDDLVSLPSHELPLSNVSVLPLSETDLRELIDHVQSGHVQKKNLC